MNEIKVLQEMVKQLKNGTPNDWVIEIQSSDRIAYFNVNMVNITDLHIIITDGDYEKSIPIEHITADEVRFFCGRCSVKQMINECQIRF